jgi:hypothetical protein
MWMNEHEVQEVLINIAEAHDVEEVPNLYTGARVLDALVEWTNENSDGWPYWTKPSRAARSLMEVFTERSYAIRFGQDRDGSPLADITEADLKRVLTPVKSFLARQGVDYSAALPWAAVLPAA